MGASRCVGISVGMSVESSYAIYARRTRDATLATRSRRITVDTRPRLQTKHTSGVRFRIGVALCKSPTTRFACFGSTRHCSHQEHIPMTTQKTKPAATKTVENRVNVAALLGAREALTATPAAAQFKWRATSDWLNGTH